MPFFATFTIPSTARLCITVAAPAASRESPKVSGAAAIPTSIIALSTTYSSAFFATSNPIFAVSTPTPPPSFMSCLKGIF